MKLFSDPMVADGKNNAIDRAYRQIGYTGLFDLVSNMFDESKKKSPIFTKTARTIFWHVILLFLTPVISRHMSSNN
jgi:hypothetical protein